MGSNCKKMNNFLLSIRVWGVTNVRVEIFVKSLEEPIEKERLLILEKSVVF